jgi:branched-chain amino acid transport system substrate-binding protein
MRTFKNFVLIFAIICIQLFGCTTSENIIKIGVIAPLTGEGATYGASMKRGFNLAFQADSSIKLIYEDDKLLPKEGINAINKLISTDKVNVILGSAASAVTMAIAPIAEKNKKVLFSTISTTDNLRNAGEYIFRNVPRNEVQGSTAAEFLFYKLNIKVVGVFGENDEYGTNLSKSFKSKFAELGGKISFDNAYSSGQKDFKTALTNANTSGIEALYIPGNYQESSLILIQAKELGVKFILIGGDGSYSPELISIAGNSAEGFYATIMSVDRQSDYYSAFYKLFVSNYKQEPDIYDAYAYEGGTIILETIKSVGYDADSIKNYLYKTSFSSLTGILKFDQDGEVQRNYGIVKVALGHFEEIK